MNFGVLFEKVTDKDFPPGYFYAHIPSVGLTTHGLGIDGARAAASDLLRLWIVEKHANGEPIPPAGETLFSTLELPDDALQSALRPWQNCSAAWRGVAENHLAAGGISVNCSP